MLGDALFPYKAYVADGGIAVFAISLSAVPLTLLGLIMMKFGQYVFLHSAIRKSERCN